MTMDTDPRDPYVPGTYAAESEAADAAWAMAAKGAQLVDQLTSQVNAAKRLSDQLNRAAEQADRRVSRARVAYDASKGAGQAPFGPDQQLRDSELMSGGRA